MAGDRSKAGSAREESTRVDQAIRALRAGKEDVGVAAATVAAHVADADPHTGYQKESEKGVANGYAGLGAGGLVPVAQLASGVPDGTKFVRDDGTLAAPSGGVPVEIPNAVLVTDSTGAMAWLDASAAVNGDVLSKRDSADPQFEFAAPGGGGGSTITFGTATVNFGAFPGSSEASVAVAGQAGILSTSKVDVFIMASDTSGSHTANDHRYAALLLAFSATTPDVGVGFTIHARCLDKMQGSFAVRWRWS